MNISEILILLLGLILFVFLVIVRGVKLGSSGETIYELERQAKTGNERAKKRLEQEKMLPDLVAFHQVLEIFLLVGVIACLLYSLGWLMGIIVSVVVLVLIGTFTRQKMVVGKSQKLYQRYENLILDIAAYVGPFLKWLRQTTSDRAADFHLHSKEELLHLVSEAKEVLTDNERDHIKYALNFESKYIRDIMTPAHDVQTIKAGETLGPIVLDRLHKTGHAHFPVIKKDLHQVVGILTLNDVLVQAKNNTASTATKLMQTEVYYLHQNQSLRSALAAFLRHGSSLFIVIDEQEQTTGVITLSDIIKALIGRTQTDEFDQYEDLRAVANRAATTRHKSDPSTHR